MAPRRRSSRPAANRRGGGQETLALKLIAIAIVVVVLAGLGGVFWFTPDLFTSTAPILVGLVLAVPLTMLGANKAAGLKLKANGLFMTPEERRPPTIVRAALGAACEPPIRWFARDGRPIGPTKEVREAA